MCQTLSGKSRNKPRFSSLAPFNQARTRAGRLLKNEQGQPLAKLPRTPPPKRTGKMTGEVEPATPVRPLEFIILSFVHSVSASLMISPMFKVKLCRVLNASRTGSCTRYNLGSVAQSVTT
jgi:hypothetical protein